MSKKFDKKALILFALLAVGMASASGLFSIIPQDRPTADNTIDLIEGQYSLGQNVYSGYSVDGTGVAGQYNYGASSCPNLESVDFCRVYFGTASGGGVGSVGGFIDWTGSGNPQVYGVPVRVEKGHSFTFAVSSGQKFIAGLVTFENLMQCSDGSYNYRSLCPVNENVNIIVRINDEQGTVADGAVADVNGQIKTVSAGGGVSYTFARGAALNVKITKEGYKTITDSWTVANPSATGTFNPFANQRTYRLDGNAVEPPSCTPNWQTSSWNSCQPSGFHTRTVQDANNCGSVTNQPISQEPCNYIPPQPKCLIYVPPQPCGANEKQVTVRAGYIDSNGCNIAAETKCEPITPTLDGSTTAILAIGGLSALLVGLLWFIRKRK